MPRGDLQKLGDGHDAFGAVDVALARSNDAFDAFFREHATAGIAASAAVGVRQQSFDLTDAGVFPDVEFLVGDGE